MKKNSESPKWGAVSARKNRHVEIRVGRSARLGGLEEELNGAEQC